MRGRLAPFLFALALTATGCAGQRIDAKPGEIDESTFVTHVADFEGDVGRGLSLATDADGNPHMAYLAFADPQRPGPTPGPSPTVAGAPALPAVKHAHLVGGAWTRSVVADGVPVDPEANGTGISVDSNGVHHVVWTEGSDLVYSNNAGGAFSEPLPISTGVSAAALTVTASGIPWAAYFGTRGVEVTAGGPEPFVEPVAPEARLEPGSVAIGSTGDTVLVAFSDGEGVTLARRETEGWVTEVADPEGAFGLSMHLDADANPHLAYYTAFGAQGGEVRHAHSIGGAPWEISTVAEVGGAPPEQAITSIGVAEDGTHHVAWQTPEGIGYANNAEGDFVEQEFPDAAGGTGGRVATGSEGVVYVAWYDPKDTEVHLAVRGGAEPLLAVPQPGPTGAQPTTQPTGPPPCEPSGTELSVAASGIAFDTDCLAAPAGEPFTIQFENQDAGIPHNVAIYTGPPPSEAVFAGEIFPGPDSRTYEVDALDAGQLYFQCDVHPNMNGTFVVV